jgi:hypothetical protein
MTSFTFDLAHRTSVSSHRRHRATDAPHRPTVALIVLASVAQAIGMAALLSLLAG